MYSAKKLSEICSIRTGKKDVNYSTEDGLYPFFTCWEKVYNAPDYSFDWSAILIAGNGDVGACKKYDGKFEAYQRTYVLMDYSWVNRDYLFYFLNGNLARLVKAETLWTAIPYIKLGSLTNREIPLPSLSTQSHIVARLDSAFASIDEQISLFRANIVDVENIWKSSLDKVFQDDSYEKIPVGNLLQIKHWYAFSGEWFSESGDYLLLTPWNFSKQSGLILREQKEKYFVGDFSKEFLLKKGDLLVAMTDLSSSAPILWAPWIVTQDNMLHNQRLGLIEKLSELLSKAYLYYFFQSNAYRSRVKLTATGTTVRHTAPKRIYEIQIPLPPLPCQHEIVAHLDQVFETTRALRTEYEAQIRYLEVLKQSLLEEAFTGRLVPEEDEA